MLWPANFGVRSAGLTWSVLTLVGCGQAFEPYSYVNGLRVLGVAADSPMLHPGEVADLSILAVDPTQSGLQPTTVWISCDPDPLNLAIDPCAQFTTLRNPNDFFSGCLAVGCPTGQVCDITNQTCVQGCSTAGCAAGQTCDSFTQTCFSVTQPVSPRVQFLGVDDTAAYGAPFHLFDSLAPNDPNRIRGLLATIFGITIDANIPPPATPQDVPRFINDFKIAAEAAESGQIADVIFVNRIPIVDVTVQENQNPEVEAIVLAGTDYQPGGPLPRVLPEQHYDITVHTAPDPTQCFHTVDSQGNPVQEVMCPDGTMGEMAVLIAIWFTTAGAYDNDRTAIADLDNGFTGPAGSSEDPIPCSAPAPAACDRTGIWWVTLQDGRGGASWLTLPFFVCDPTQPSPVIAEVAPAPLAPGQTFSVQGSHLDQVLDASVGDSLVQGGYDPASQTWIGAVPAGTDSGSTTLTLHGRDCVDASISIAVE
jgi:hypothetical protein